MRDEDQVFIGDAGEVMGDVIEINRTSFTIKIKQGGKLGAGNHVMKIPGTRIQQLPVLTFEDRVDLREIIVKNSFDYVSVPNV